MNRFVRSRASLVVCIDKSPYLPARLWGIEEKTGIRVQGSIIHFFCFIPFSRGAKNEF